MQFHNFLHDRSVFGSFSLINHIRIIRTDHRLVGRNNNYIQTVNLLEFLFLRLGCTGHAGQFLVHTEIILERDGSQGLAFALHHHAFLGFDGLVEAFGIPAPVHQTSGKFVNDDNLSVFHYIIPVADHQGLSLNRAHDMVGEVHTVFRIVQIADAQRLFRFGDTRLCRRNLLLLFIDGVILALFHVGDDTGYNLVQIGRLLTGTGNNQRGTGFVNQDGVHFVHDTVIELPLYHLILVYHHIITEVIKAELIVGAVCDICLIRSLPFREIKIMNNQTDRQPQKIINTAHINTVSTGQVIVDGNHMDTVTGQCVQIHRQCCHKGLAFAGTHLRNLSPVQHHAANQLHVKMAQTGGSLGRFPHHRKGFRQNIVQRLTFFQAQLELCGLCLQVGGTHPFHLGFQRIDFVHNRLDIF